MATNDLGELSEELEPEAKPKQQEQLKSLEEEVEEPTPSFETRGTLNLDEYDPRFTPTELPRDIKHCTRCGNRIPSPLLAIDGECMSCATKRMRRIDTFLQQRKQLKASRKYCIIPEHGETAQDQLHPDWNKITVFGVDFYPPDDLCQPCYLKLRTYFIRYLEDRGFNRRESNHFKNEWGDPQNQKIPIKDHLENIHAFQDFMAGVEAYVADEESGMKALHKRVTDKFKFLSKKEFNKRCEEKLQIENLERKYYPVLRKPWEAPPRQQFSQLEYEDLERKSLPTKVRQLATAQALKMLQTQLVLLPKALEEEPEKFSLENPEHQLLYQEILTTLTNLLGPHARYAEEILNRALEVFSKQSSESKEEENT